MATPLVVLVDFISIIAARAFGITDPAGIGFWLTISSTVLVGPPWACEIRLMASIRFFNAVAGSGLNGPISALERSPCPICNIRIDCPFGTSTTALRSNPTVWSAGPLTTQLPIVCDVQVQPSGTPTLPVPSGKLYVCNLMSAGGIDCGLLPRRSGRNGRRGARIIDGRICRRICRNRTGSSAAACAGRTRACIGGWL